MNRDLKIIKDEINAKIADKEVFNSLLATTFKGLQPQIAKRAMLDGALRGFNFEDFLEKNVYAVPFKDGYSLVTSIDYARKIGARSGIVGKEEPEFEEKDGKIISCKITLKKSTQGIIGEYSERVYFSEYTTGKNLWQTKPRTMLAKVAEMHALRMACPEELSQAYIEEDYQKEVTDVDVEPAVSDEIASSIASAKTKEELNVIYKNNEGLGKEFSKMVSDRKAELTKKTDENS